MGVGRSPQIIRQTNKTQSHLWGAIEDREISAKPGKSESKARWQVYGQQ